MIHATENGSENNLPVHPAKVTRGIASLSRTLLRSRAVLRLARKRHSLALGLALATGAAVSAAYATVSVVTHQVEAHDARVEPLAPAPAPPAPPVELTKKRHPILSFRATAFRGLASWYGEVWNGRTTASGETFDETKLTAAHKTLPLGTIVRVTDMENMKSVVVKINDRGTLAPDRVIDLSSAAAKELGIIEQGLAKVKLEIVKKAS
ncbi:septal ring lytic transglycosylase RlpA family protein [Terriglobus sp. RCC_193]|uniref:septal ring lytic transglycosylase RlpA family protein n=1 Tax=Terriglobus sp. RCC_193 TaxID=3239218 RepID=UPI0035253223